MDSPAQAFATSTQQESPNQAEQEAVSLRDSEPGQKEAWSLPVRLAFRFGFAYLVLYSFPFPLTQIPGVASLFNWYDAAWKKLVIWTGAHVLHLSQPVQYAVTGSGDTMHDYIQNGLIVVFAVAAMLVWSVMDRRRREYRYLHEWLRVYVRLVLGATLLSYGAAKVIKSQFPYPHLFRLLEPYGDSSPMGLLWTFMGYSRAYNIFTGLVEMVGGALLFVPRLTTLGAFLAIGAMGNVFMLNMSYDVPVKIYSFNLLVMGCFLLVPELGRLTHVLVLNRTADAVVAPALFRRKWLNVGILAFQLLFLVYTCTIDLYEVQQGVKQYGDDAPKPPLYGIYSVDEMTVDGQVRPPVFSDAARWRRFVFDGFSSIGVQPADGPMQRYFGKLDLKAKTLQLTKRGDQAWKANFTVLPDTPTTGQILLSGEMDGKKIQAKLRRVDDKEFPLNSRGFHWISEFPYNR